MGVKLDKKSAVKHRTNAPFDLHASRNAPANVKGKGKGGFKVGPNHAPDGAYLGRGM